MGPEFFVFQPFRQSVEVPGFYYASIRVYALHHISAISVYYDVSIVVCNFQRFDNSCDLCNIVRALSLTTIVVPNVIFTKIARITNGSATLVVQAATICVHLCDLGSDSRTDSVLYYRILLRFF
eukprot:NODE_222_length_13951_cov_0.396982.p12 type:complete len:124 gc:universal NODE_222_length_13951_cov_0.396982:8150-7779(-)